MAETSHGLKVLQVSLVAATEVRDEQVPVSNEQSQDGQRRAVLSVLPWCDLP